MVKPVYIQGREELLKKIGENYENKIVFMFTAKWCGPCKGVKSVFEGGWTDQHENVAILYIDIDDHMNEDIVEEFEVESIPSFVINQIDDGKLVKLHTFNGADIKLLEELLE
jgi:thiol-disulfide isomerase/thioredoxin